MYAPYKDRPLNGRELEKLRLTLSSFRDGSGQVTIPGIQTEARARLLGHYDAYEPFLQSCRDARLELESKNA